MTLPEIRALLVEEKAALVGVTRGPWIVDETRGVVDGISVDDEDGELIVETDCGCYPPGAEDAMFIATSRTARPMLCEAIETLLGLLDAGDDR